MTNLFIFPEMRSQAANAGDSLRLQSADGVIDFQSCGQQHPTLGTGQACAQSGDWSNQELADLYRVEAILLQAGIKLTSARGLSDENDPWFVFSKENGDDLVHFARIDGLYMLLSPGMEQALEGDDFASLIDAFAETVYEKTRARQTDNVLAFPRKRQRTSLAGVHPSVLLAALVWTLYWASDDFASATEMTGSIAFETGLLNDTITIPLELIDSASHVALTDAALAVSLATAAEISENDAFVTGKKAGASGLFNTLSDRGASSGSEASRTITSSDARGTSVSAGSFAPAPGHVQTVAASLAIVAFSCGLQGSRPTDGEEVTAARILQGLDLSLADIHQDHLPANRDINTAGPFGVRSTTEDDSAHTALAGLVDNLDLEADIAFMASPSLPHADALAVEQIAPMATAEGSEAQTEVPETRETASEQADRTNEAQTPIESPPAPIAAAPVVKQQTRPVTEPDDQSAGNAADGTLQSSLAHRWDGLKKLGLSDYTLTGSLDLKSLDDVIDQISLASPSASQASGDNDNSTSGDLTASTGSAGASISNTGGSGTTKNTAPDISVMGAKIEAFSTSIESFVNSFIRQTPSIEILHFQTELVIIDTSAIDDITDHAHVRSWITDDGYVISTVGHYQFFDNFKLA